VPPVDVLKLGAKNIKLMRPQLVSYIVTEEERAAYTKELFELLLAGKVKVKIHEVYPLKDVGQAHSDLEGRKTAGKLLLKV
jgi:NADPH2:quinone reductase